MKRFLPLMVLGSFAFAVACAGVKQSGSSGGGGGSGSSGTGSGGSTPPPACNGACTDFPPDPLIVDGAPPNAPSTFGDPSNGGNGGPCLIEPAIGALYPNNWLRPRFNLSPGSGQNLFEIRLHAANQANDLVVYTGNHIWTMPKDMWNNLAGHTRDTAITISVRGAAGGTVSKGTVGDFTIAPVGASGTMVYWSTKGLTMGDPMNGDTSLSGFAVGDESVVSVLNVGQATEVAKDQGNNPLAPTKRCIGCHTSTPDGLFISYNDFYPWNVILVSSKPDPATPTMRLPPTYMGIGGYTATTQPWLGISTYSKAHWSDGDHMMVASLGTSGMDADPRSQLAWFNLEDSTTGLAATLKGKAFDYIPRTGDARGAASPAWSHDGTFIVYTSTDSQKSGRLGSGTADLFTVPYANRAGGTATPVPGASDPNTAEYYPAISGDDKLIAYDAIPQAAASGIHAPIGITGATAWDGMYAQPLTQVFVIPRAGGAPTRLNANDPPQCAGVSSPGINNTWPKWSPQVSNFNGKNYYWLIFSSWRDGLHTSSGAPIAQLYVTGVVQDETGIASYSAIYLWNQPADISNHTPAWDIFQIPTVQ